MKYTFAALGSGISLLSGFAAVRYLTCDPAYMSAYLIFTCLLCFILLSVFFLQFKREKDMHLTLFLSVIFFIVGYMATLYFFMNTPEVAALPPLIREKGDKGLGHTAIIVLAHGEPENYDAGAWIKQMKEFDEQKITFVPYPVRPFFFNSLRSKYLIAGKSGHNEECLQVMKQLEAHYRGKGDTSTRFYISYLESAPHPDAAVIKALNEGASHIILCNIFLTISNHTQEAIDMINSLELDSYGVGIKYTRPLYDSDTLMQLYTDEVEKNTLGRDRKKTGVILVGHGQPEEWDKEFYTETQQETAFRLQILKKLELQGFDPQNLLLAWMEFRKPEPSEAVRELINNDVDKIFYFSTIIGSESIHAKYDVPALMQKIKIPDPVTLKQLTAFREKTSIVKALAERIDECR